MTADKTYHKVRYIRVFFFSAGRRVISKAITTKYRITFAVAYLPLITRINITLSGCFIRYAATVAYVVPEIVCKFPPAVLKVTGLVIRFPDH
jgi:hypothetical protein